MAVVLRKKWGTSMALLRQFTAGSDRLSVGTTLTRKIEAAEGLPARWLDSPDDPDYFIELTDDAPAESTADLPGRLRSVMREIGHTEFALAKLNGTSTATLNRAINGFTKNVRSDTMNKWARALGVRKMWLDSGYRERYLAGRKPAEPSQDPAADQYQPGENKTDLNGHIVMKRL